ncbi:MAG: ABC-F family ATP-binding cassette domain-containing protein [Actinobacteria bacterium]|nr:ABC-F family ATP-binding cassette domain-containing protein [Actinomycetota bacterium]
MNILSMENVTKAFSDKVLFENVSLGINENDRIGLVGINGTGKTTFLKLISGQLEPDSGRIVRSAKLSIQRLEQTLKFEDNETVMEHMLKGAHPAMQVIPEYENILKLASKSPGDLNLQGRLSGLAAKMDETGAWDFESKINKILERLKVPFSSAYLKELSGGQQKRIALAKALMHPSDLLILDEPTNHIDLETIKWLEDYFAQLKSALLLVTHDRYFLNRIVNRILEIDKGCIYSYEGNFEYFLEKKTLRQQAQNKIEEKRRRLYLSELAWIRRGARARTTKQKARIKRFEVISVENKDSMTKDIEIPVAYRRLGNKVIELKNVSKSFKDKKVINNFTYTICPGDKIGIAGPNGSGKTVLLNILARSMHPDSGMVDVGSTVKTAFYRQNNEDMDDSIKVIDYIKETAEYVTAGDGSSISAGQMLERFLFEPNQQYSLIKNLSGGERRRLNLAKVLMGHPNVLLLDEPTNDLDIQTLEVLEEYLEYFQGVVIAASHDRYFLDKTTDKILAIKSGGNIVKYNNVEEYISYINELSSKPKKSLPVAEVLPVQKKKTKFTYAESREFLLIEDEISKLESDIAAVSEEMSRCWSDYLKISKLSEKHQNLQTQLAAKMQRWVYLNEIAEKIK